MYKSLDGSHSTGQVSIGCIYLSFFHLSCLVKRKFAGISTVLANEGLHLPSDDFELEPIFPGCLISKRFSSVVVRQYFQWQIEQRKTRGNHNYRNELTTHDNNADGNELYFGGEFFTKSIPFSMLPLRPATAASSNFFSCSLACSRTL